MYERYNPFSFLFTARKVFRTFAGWYKQEGKMDYIAHTLPNGLRMVHLPVNSPGLFAVSLWTLYTGWSAGIPHPDIFWKIRRVRLRCRDHDMPLVIPARFRLVQYIQNPHPRCPHPSIRAEFSFGTKGKGFLLYIDRVQRIKKRHRLII